MAELLAHHSDQIEFQGLYAHCGNSYQGTNDEAVKQARDESIKKLDQVAQSLKDQGLEVKHQGIGSTPSCSQNVEGMDFKSLTEIHPGNYVFYDLQQEKVRIGGANLKSVILIYILELAAKSILGGFIIWLAWWTGFSFSWGASQEFFWDRTQITVHSIEIIIAITA